jgi:hypothetical protein
LRLHAQLLHPPSALLHAQPKHPAPLLLHAQDVQLLRHQLHVLLWFPTQLHAQLLLLVQYPYAQPMRLQLPLSLPRLPPSPQLTGASVTPVVGLT